MYKHIRWWRNRITSEAQDMKDKPNWTKSKIARSTK